MSKTKNNRKSFKLSDFFFPNLKLENKKLYFGDNIKLIDLANVLKIEPKSIFKLIDGKSNEQILSDEEVMEIAQKNKFDFEKIESISEANVLEKINNLVSLKKWDVEKVSRTPIVTIMGHVDHGKTTLLDTIRKSNIASKEIGGITQKIGAYQITNKKGQITFIDTPGHEAFASMRMKGSQITDILVIVVAADDSVMPQTKESIEHAKAANVQMIIAINKIDKPGVDLEKVKNQISELGVMPEEWGGTTPFIGISGLTGEGIDKLLETILLLAEVKELNTYKDLFATGVVLESTIDKQKGNLVTLLVQNGTLNIGDTILIDDSIVKVKSMTNDLGKRIEQAFPSQPVEVFGLGFSPIVGSKFVVVNEDKEVQKIATFLKNLKQTLNVSLTKEVNIDDLFTKASGNSKKTFNIMLKADGKGVLDAIASKVEHFESETTKVSVISKDIGEVTTADISLAEATKSSIYTFAVKVSETIKKLADTKGVKIYSFDIIYKLFEDIEEKIIGIKTKKYQENKIGEVEVRAIFNSSKFGEIAGCQVKEGKVLNKSIIEVFRKGKSIIKTKISTLKTQKDDVKERKAGQECGITLEGFSKFEIGDIFVVYELVEV